MKNRYLAGLFGLFILTITTSFAQEAVPVKQHISDKPFIFSQLPDRFELPVAELTTLLAAQKSSAVTLTLAGGKALAGVVTEKIQQSPLLTSINIKVSNYPGALFTISVVSMDDHSQKITGRIVHPQGGDVLILTQDASRFFFEKRQQKYFMPE